MMCDTLLIGKIGKFCVVEVRRSSLTSSRSLGLTSAAERVGSLAWQYSS